MPPYLQREKACSQTSHAYKFLFCLQILKYDILTKSALKWEEEGCWPAEPLFVPAPGAKDEDDGKIEQAAPHCRRQLFSEHMSDPHVTPGS